MTRREQIEKAAKELFVEMESEAIRYSATGQLPFPNKETVVSMGIIMAEWADRNPNPIQGEIINALNSQAGDFEEKWRKLQARMKRVIEQGNYLDTALTGMLESDDVECRADEDCDHCFATQAQKEWSEVLGEK